MKHVVSFGQKIYFDSRVHPQILIICILQTRIGLPQDKIFFSLKVLLLYTVGKYIKNEAKFNKIASDENELVASYNTMKFFSSQVVEYRF